MAKSLFDCAIFQPSEFRWLIKSQILLSARPALILRCPVTDEIEEPRDGSSFWEYRTGQNFIDCEANIDDVTRMAEEWWIDIPLEPPSEETAKLLLEGTNGESPTAAFATFALPHPTQPGQTVRVRLGES